MIKTISSKSNKNLFIVADDDQVIYGWNGASNQRIIDFKDEFEMTDVLIDTINKYVKENDIIYFLGDFTFGGLDKIYKFRNEGIFK